MSMVQFVSYGFTTVENPLSDNGNFTTPLAGVSQAAVEVPSSGVCEPTALGGSVCGAFWSGVVGAAVGGKWPADQYSEVTALALTPTNAGDIFGPICRYANASNNGTWYEVNCVGALGSAGAGSATLYSRVSGTSTNIGSSTGLTFKVGDVIRLTCSGSTISVTQNGITLISVTSVSITAAGPTGFLLKNTTAIADTKISLWAAGGNLVSGSDGTSGISIFDLLRL